MPNYVVTLKPGESIVLPANTRLITFTTEGDAQLTSSCNVLPPFENKACYSFLATSDGGGESTYRYLFIKSITLGGTVYTFPGEGCQLTNQDNFVDINVFYTNFHAVVPKTIMHFAGYSGAPGNNSNRKNVTFFFQVLPSLAVDAEINIQAQRGSTRVDMFYHLNKNETCNPEFTPTENPGAGGPSD